MGISSDGIHFYGVAFTDDDDAHEIIGLLREEEGDFGELTEWFAAKGLPVDVGLHCSFEYTMYYLYIVESETKAYRGSPKRAADIIGSTSWNDQIHRAAEAMGVELEPDSIGWWVTSLYG